MTTWIGEMDSPRQRLLAAIDQQSSPTTLKQLSLALGLNQAYLQQYLRRGTPLHLPEAVRYQLAELLGIAEAELRPDNLPAPTVAAGTKPQPGSMSAMPSQDTLAIGFLDHPAHQHLHSQTWHIGKTIANRQRLMPDATGAKPGTDKVAQGKPPKLKLVVVGDDAMAPTINRGDIIIIDASDTNPHLAGVFAIDAGDHIRLRYVEQPDGDRPELIVRHEDSSGFAIKQPRQSVRILGRGLWRLGRL